MKWLRAIAICIVAGAALVLPGCGGGHDTAARGEFAVRVTWPSSSATRILPAATQRIEVTVSNSAGYSVTQTRQRLPEETEAEISFPNVPVGTIDVHVDAYANATPVVGETIIGTATAATTVTADTVSEVPLNFRSTVNSLSILQEVARVNVAATVNLAATAYDAEGAVVPLAPNGIVWHSLNPEIAQVAADGTVTGLQPGSAVITAIERETGASDALTVTITAANGTLVVDVVNDPVYLTLDSYALTLAPGGTHQFSTTVHGIPNQYVVWTASAGGISENGLYIAPTSPGTYTITAASSYNTSKTASATVKVQ